MKISIIGTGYVGLVTGLGFANLGNDVICLDTDKKKIDNLRLGELPIYEPGLRGIYERNIKENRLHFTTNATHAVDNSDIIFIAVGTPSDEKGCADLQYVKQAAESIGRYMHGYKVIVNKSTVPVGTANMVRKIIADNQKEKMRFDVVSNPEFLREGAAVKDFENPDRIVIGTDSKKAEEIMTSLYSSVARVGKPIVITDIKSAEIIKYASNCMLATRISFMNQLSFLCEKTGADIKEVAKGMGFDSRIGPRFLQAGIGYGGSCFPKDVRALVQTLREHGCDSDIFEAVENVNNKQKTVIVQKLLALINPRKKKIAVWGLSFKPKTGDVREAPSLDIIRELQGMGAIVHAYDPAAMDNAKMYLDTNFAESPMDAAKGAHALLVLTEWNEFRNLDLAELKSVMKKPIMIDGRNIYEPKICRGLGFTYIGIGR